MKLKSILSVWSIALLDRAEGKGDRSPHSHPVLSVFSHCDCRRSTTECAPLRKNTRHT
ncbi:hypothetical protein RISK_004446 [Rhodopirellula islandica]|uniref:Uncharacterized protein n=1 Tax=Rhodopirellula islandica TaxID=595434 RepID=A0A0J1EDC0_RHOIS|nr:hypothetical protein RISK_004446 [Rhodopirellula islandica]